MGGEQRCPGGRRIGVAEQLLQHDDGYIRLFLTGVGLCQTQLQIRALRRQGQRVTVDLGSLIVSPGFCKQLTEMLT